MKSAHDMIIMTIFMRFGIQNQDLPNMNFWLNSEMYSELDNKWFMVHEYHVFL